MTEDQEEKLEECIRRALFHSAADTPDAPDLISALKDEIRGWLSNFALRNDVEH